MVDTLVPGGRFTTSALRSCPRGASPPSSETTIATMSTRISTKATTSNTTSALIALRTSREAAKPMTAHPNSASGYQGKSDAMPVLFRNASPKTATPDIETAGNTR